ncbi:hypothetical protein [Photobacterium leiognathi]|uniref:hypothetical protein n=1 Tax=Photobacterium leiognathi TaxID=553611 RepID=UPI000D16242D|nr:hypothetical protein [Photobacterium leiognathi]PSW57868.1 hypothetical protein C0W50_07200 [Photobacterium leiognathi subsp. mandapamensis]
MGNQPNSSIVGKVIIEAVENQLAVNHPPKVRKTLDRLLALGISHEEAIKYIACALSVEVFGVVRDSEGFNPERYDNNLECLPDLPWED